MSTCVVCSAPAKVYCENDKAFLCKECDVTIHTSNALAAKHTRVPTCDLCFHNVATTFCKNDNAYLCNDCDHAIHLNNPLASRHEVVSASVAFAEALQGGSCCACPPGKSHVLPEQSAAHSETGNMTGNLTKHEEVECTFDDLHVVPNFSEHAPKPRPSLERQGLQGQGFTKDLEGLELDNSWLDRLDMCFDFSDIMGGSEAVVPSLSCNSDFLKQGSVSSYELKQEDIWKGQTSPDGAIESSLGFVAPDTTDPATKTCAGLTREQRVLRYREKRKRRKFEKTIRYASRKAYAEVRPRIKGRFAKRGELDMLATASMSYYDDHFEDLSDAAVVPEIGAV